MVPNGVLPRVVHAVMGRRARAAHPLWLCLFAAATVSAQSAHHGGTVDPTERTQVIDEVLTKVHAFYVSSKTAELIDEDIRAREIAGGYNNLSAEQFVRALTRDLQAISGDRHFRVEFSRQPINSNVPSSPPAVPLTPWPASEAYEARLRSLWREQNCTFVNVAVLPVNIGYVKFNGFPPPSLCGDTAAAAMRFVADSRALVIDLLDNGGGDPAMMTFIASYLFSEPVHLNDLYEPRTKQTVQSWTLPFVSGPKFIGKSVFVVTSPRTFSAAEGFAYALQARKRAIVVGETTGGGAHAALPLRINSHFSVAVPFARTINPVTGSSWEGRGVQPDVRSAEPVAVHTAYRAALRELAQSLPPSDQRTTVEREIERLTRLIESKD